MTNIQGGMLILSIVLSILMPILIIFLLIFISGIDSRRKSRFRRRMMKKIKSIDKRDEFESIYTEMLNNLGMDKLKTDARNNVLTVIFGYFIVIFGSVFTIFEILCRGNRNQFLMSIILLACLFAGITLIKKKTSKYKGEVIEQFVKAIKPNIKYTNNISRAILDYMDKINLDVQYKEQLLTYTKSNFNADRVKMDLYSDSGFRDEGSNRTYVTDYIEYETNLGSGVKMADLHLQAHTSGKHSSTSEIYEGIIAKISREKYIENEILIERNKIIKKGNRVKSELDEFERYFDIYAKEQNSIDLILPVSIKEQILSLYKEYGIMFEISIKGKDIFVRFFTGSMFESIVFGTSYSKKKLYREYVIFKSILEIIDRLDEIF